ncbi:protein kinase domain-containing protein [Umezawaea sp. Da 62-37]|uniref:protein kinase domain-containing protein n=1 Tax=Umezawaea sp. Da 62-37 TaxID=3075927 RepID=UPI0028F6D570|nr:protein kinase [Umezawaea sp. Da 62-37]WNV82256.1 protein kinase [Umezawaea sp. Da 62-37]
MGLAESLLVWLHGWALPLCPGDWAWSVTALGAAAGLLPTVAALLAITVRRVVGNSYGPVAGAIFAALGVSSTLVLPWLLFSGADEVLRRRTIAGTESLDDSPCGVFTQYDYLVGARSIGTVISDPGGTDVVFLVAAGVTAVLALLCLLFVMMQAGSAFRLGPNWPRRVFWPPFLVLLVATSLLPVTLVGHLLLGFFPIALIGSFVVRIFGLTTAMLNRPGRDRGNEPPKPAVSRQPPPPQQQPSNHGPQKPPPYQPAQIPPYRPPGAPPPYQPHQSPQQSPQSQPQPVQKPQQPRQYPPTRIAEVPQGPAPTRVEPPKGPGQPQGPAPTRVESPQGPPPTRVEHQQGPPSGGQPLSKLADTPGPLPFGPGAASATPNPTAHTGEDKVWNPASGRFRRVRQLGRGGFGTVWLAVDTQLDRTVAVKLAHAPDADTEQRMLREARALAAVRHPNCVRVFDIIQDPDGLAIVMEYIDGDPLSDVVLNSGLLADALAARLWVNMADALAAAHDRGVLHRDVKPSNVIVDTSGTAHLIDFGIARSKGDSTLTAAGMMVGTPDFLAPETARGDAASPASDAWQLAATVSYALTGHPPRGTRDSPISSLMAAAQGEPNVKLPTRSVHHRLLLSALDADPARRPSLAAIRGELSGWLSNAGVSKEGPVTRMISKPDPPTRPVR